jgi:hypothetical protein
MATAWAGALFSLIATATVDSATLAGESAPEVIFVA